MLIGMFEQWIGETRARFAGSRWRRSLLGLRELPLPAVFRREGIEGFLIPGHVQLAEHGRVVWGAVAQANALAFKPGNIDFPANALFGTDLYWDSHPHHLLRIAKRIFKLKGTFPDDPVRKKIAAVITDEMNFVSNWRLPYIITDGHDVMMTSILMHRSRLPDGVLTTQLFPLVVEPKRSKLCMLLPLACWPSDVRRDPSIIAEAMETADAITQRPVTRQQLENDEREAREHPHKTTVADDLMPEASAAILSLTPNCARIMKKLAQENELGKTWHVRVGGTENVRTCELSGMPIPEGFEVVKSADITIAMPKAILRQVRGSVIDYRETALGAGFIFVDRYGM